jgi:hypothetical protein
MRLVSLILILAVATVSDVAQSATARGPICDTAARVGSTTYYSCNGGYHGALDMSNRTCNSWNHRGMIVGSRYYRYYGGCGQTCSGSPNCNGGAGNYVVVTGGSGWQFRQLHIGANGSSGSKTCDRCALGLISSTGHSFGAHSHADNRRYGTRMTSWYTSAGTTCGRSAYCGNTVGYPTL